MEDVRIGIALVVTCDKCSCAFLQVDGVFAFLSRSLHGEGHDGSAVLCGHLQIACHNEGELSCYIVVGLHLSLVCSAGTECIGNILKILEIEGEFHTACNGIVLNGVIYLNGFARLNLSDIKAARKGVGLACCDQIEDDLIAGRLAGLGRSRCGLSCLADLKGQTVEDIGVGIALVVTCNECSCTVLQTDRVGAFLSRSLHGEGHDGGAVLCGHLQVACHNEGELSCDSIVRLHLSLVCSAGAECAVNILEILEIEGELHTACNGIVLNSVVDLNGLACLNLSDIIAARKGVGLACCDQIEDDLIAGRLAGLGRSRCGLSCLADLKGQTVEDIGVGIALVVTCNECSCTVLQTDRVGAFLSRSLHGEGHDGGAVLCGHLQVACHNEGELSCDSIVRLHLSLVCSAGAECAVNILEILEIEGELHTACNGIVLNSVIDLNGLACLNLSDIIAVREGVGLACCDQIQHNLVAGRLAGLG